MLTSICGINWGDEGKGRMVDLLSEKFDIVCRYQGGNNAGHTVINDRGEFVLNLLPSGILRENVVNVMGNGMVIDIRHLCNEMDKLRAAGIVITPDNLKISDPRRHHHALPRTAGLPRRGSARGEEIRFHPPGIAPVYADKYSKRPSAMGELLHKERCTPRVADIVEWKNLTIAGGYKAQPVKAEDMIAYFEDTAPAFCPISATSASISTRRTPTARTSCSKRSWGLCATSISASIPTPLPLRRSRRTRPSAGRAHLQLDNSVGIMKAYSTCVGEGPFTAEYFGGEGGAPAQAGGEYGAATGRPRRVGPFDVVASRYGIRCQGAKEIALTKLDVLSDYEELEICTAYELDGKKDYRISFTDAAGQVQAGVREGEGLAHGYLRLPEEGGSAAGGARLHRLYRKGVRLPYPLRLRRRGAGRCIDMDR